MLRFEIRKCYHKSGDFECDLMLVSSRVPHDNEKRPGPISCLRPILSKM